MYSNRSQRCRCICAVCRLSAHQLYNKVSNTKQIATFASQKLLARAGGRDPPRKNFPVILFDHHIAKFGDCLAMYIGVPKTLGTLGRCPLGMGAMADP